MDEVKELVGGLTGSEWWVALRGLVEPTWDATPVWIRVSLLVFAIISLILSRWLIPARVQLIRAKRGK